MVIDAKLSVYKGCLEDVQKYLKCNGVEKVVIWSYRPAYNLSGNVKVLDKKDLKKKISENLVSTINDFEPTYNEKEVKQVEFKDF